ncbi:MAG: sprT domain-containing protein, partial [Agrobacterium sp.]|nr:sprT domain-containing protein [Agrobacterium sp.]
YIVESGRYARVFAELAAQPDFTALYVELWDDADARKARKAKSASKTRYTCPSCELNAWAKPGVRLICGECDEPMAAAEEAE